MGRPATAISTCAPGIEADLGSFQVLPLAKLVESPTNHRRKTWGDLDELAASIRAKGVIVPICVRPSPNALLEGALEIVYGHRRFRAATTAGLTEIPALVRQLSDLDVIEVQILENLQRTDVHPLEEAEGYEQLLASKERPYTVDDIAAKVGKSRGYVYGRLKLLDLTAESRAAFYDGATLSPSTALLLARVPAELQAEALQALQPRWRDGDTPLPAREAARILREGFMRALAEAPFPIEDAELVPSVGSCSSCPRRTGAQPELFSDVGRGDVCTDPTCYAGKLDAVWERKKTEAEAAGKAVLSEKESKDAFDGTHVRTYQGQYVDPASVHEADPKRRSLAKLLGKRLKEATVLARDGAGNIRELVPKNAVGRLLKAAGHDFKSQREAVSPEEKERRAKQQAEALLAQEVAKQQRTAVLKAIGAKEPGDEFWRLAAVAMEEAAHEAIIDELGEAAADVEVEHYVAQMKGTALRTFVLGLVIEPLLGRFVYGEAVKAQKSLLAWAKVDEKAIRAKAKEAMKAASRESKPRRQEKGIGTVATDQGNDEVCLDCGVGADQPSPGCDACDHPAKAAKKKGARRG